MPFPGKEGWWQRKDRVVWKRWGAVLEREAGWKRGEQKSRPECKRRLCERILNKWNYCNGAAIWPKKMRSAIYYESIIRRQVQGWREGWCILGTQMVRRNGKLLEVISTWEAYVCLVGGWGREVFSVIFCLPVIGLRALNRNKHDLFQSCNWNKMMAGSPPCQASASTASHLLG